MTDKKTYWEQYRDFWDGFIREWYDSCARSIAIGDGNSRYGYGNIARAYNKFFKSKNSDARLYLEELPEPYLGTPSKKLKAVMLNLNPGMVPLETEEQGVEQQKFFSKKDAYSSGPFVSESQIKKYECQYNKKYSELMQNWSCLIPKYRRKDTDLCGVEWWQGKDPLNVGGRMEWLAQIYDKQLDNGNEPKDELEGEALINPLEVFALEICPFHSRQAVGTDWQALAKEPLKGFILERVVYPAIRAVADNNLPFAVAIGAPYRDLFEKVLGIIPEKEWSHKNPVDGWPRKLKNGNEVNINRTYKIYNIHDNEGGKARILVTWSQAPGNHPPKTDGFGRVEAVIREYVQTHPL